MKVNGSNHHSRGESLRERERKKAGKGRKEGEMTGDCVGRETESKRERERGEGLKKYELVYDLAAGSIKKGEDCKQDVVMPTLFFFGFNEDKLLQDLSEGDFFASTLGHTFSSALLQSRELIKSGPGTRGVFPLSAVRNLYPGSIGKKKATEQQHEDEKSRHIEK